MKGKEYQIAYFINENTKASIHTYHSQLEDFKRTKLLWIET
jgi:hypothetical protein